MMSDWYNLVRMEESNLEKDADILPALRRNRDKAAALKENESCVKLTVMVEYWHYDSDSDSSSLHTDFRSDQL